MAVDLTKEDVVVGIVGAGVMGRGIAQIMAAGGIAVKLHDTQSDAVADAMSFVGRMLNRAAEKGQTSQEDADAAIARLTPVKTLKELAGADVVIEAIVEQVAPKQALFTELEKIVGPDCILATNTSSLSVTAIAAGCETPERLAGFHFFNPVPLLKLVEVVDGVRTAPWVGDALTALARRAGHTPVRAKDTPGFLVNHAGRGLMTEGPRIAAEGIADFAGIDDLMREAAGFRMGPFELLDVIGLDVSQTVMESIYQQFYEEPRYRPQPLTKLRAIGGLWGRKNGLGFYAYENGQKVIEDAPVPDARPEQVWISAAVPEGRAALVAALDDKVFVDSAERPGPRSICLFTPVGIDCTAAALAEKIEPERSVAIDTLFGLDGRRTVMTNPLTDSDVRDQAHALMAAGGHKVTVIHDSPGFVAPRIVATIVNVGCEIAQQRIATPDDIDRAVQLGLNYPKGPLALGDAIGPARILAILEALYAFYGDPRYRPSPWLKRRARLGASLLTPEG